MGKSIPPITETPLQPGLVGQAVETLRLAASALNDSRSRLFENNGCQENDLTCLAGKLVARWVTRTYRIGDQSLQEVEQGSLQDTNNPFDPELEPWLAAQISKSSGN